MLQGSFQSFFVAKHPLTGEQLDDIPTKRQCGLTPAWRGIVWVANLGDPAGCRCLSPDSIGGKWRIWGNVVVAGDESMMDTIEELYRNTLP
jgi:hypothetical protein